MATLLRIFSFWGSSNSLRPLQIFPLFFYSITGSVPVSSVFLHDLLIGKNILTMTLKSCLSPAMSQSHHKRYDLKKLWGPKR